MPPLATDRAVPRVSDPMDAVCEKRLVLEAVVAKKFVEVALPNTLLPDTTNE